MTSATVVTSLLLFLLAGLCEIGGGWLVWQWIREGRPWSWGLLGGLVLCLYGVVPTLQPAHFGRVYAAYGGFSLCCLFCGAVWLIGTFPTVLILSELL